MLNYSEIVFYFLLAVLPGIVWLGYFLRKDNLPEPKFQVLKVFTLGIIATVPTAFLEIILLKHLNALHLATIPYFFTKYLLAIALVEESFKYLIVRYFIIKQSSLDEPIDIPLYMIISALGFATAENILVFSNQIVELAANPFALVVVRFIGATFLHALCSGLIGCFLALSFYYFRKRWLIIPCGFILAIIFHGLFNFYIELGIINQKENLYPLLIIFLLAVIVSLFLKKLKKIKSVCKI